MGEWAYAIHLCSFAIFVTSGLLLASHLPKLIYHAIQTFYKNVGGGNSVMRGGEQLVPPLVQCVIAIVLLYKSAAIISWLEQTSFGKVHPDVLDQKQGEDNS
ncbi:MAG: hypothetical protein SH856_06335 [Flavobacteriales bacterium]|nr:hypothetical protein [Flavobacteriales bacterium]